MKARSGLVALVMIGLAALPAAALSPPDIPGFSAETPPHSYDADSLYERINGDSFTYLGFGCRGLTVLEYVGEGGRSVTAELFDHGVAANAFGIYAYERPSQPARVELGGQGYVDHERLVFFKGPYYVKLDGRGLGDDAQAVLTRFARSIAAAIQGDEGLPSLTRTFPRQGLDDSTLRYVTSDFLGHRFLRSAFVADYAGDPDGWTAFIIDAGSPEAAAKMEQDYLAFLDKKGAAHRQVEGVRTFNDPYHASEGAIRLKASGGYLLGTMGGGDEALRVLGAMDLALGEAPAGD